MIVINKKYPITQELGIFHRDGSLLVANEVINYEEDLRDADVRMNLHVRAYVSKLDCFVRK